MKFDLKSYGGEFFCPKPEVYIKENDPLILMVTPWGERKIADVVIENILNFFLTAQSDTDLTSPFELIPSLSMEGNYLRQAILLANKVIFEEDNRDEYTNAVELLAIYKNMNELVILQVGRPNILLNRVGLDLQTFVSERDLAFELRGQGADLPPLPEHLLGVDMWPRVQVNTLIPKENDQLILISKSSLPGSIYSLPEAQRTLDVLSQTMVEGDPETPFWLGVLNL